MRKTLPNRVICEYTMEGQADYSAAPFVWHIGTKVSTPEKVVLYETNFSHGDWSLTKDPYMMLEFNYWFYNKDLDKIMVSYDDGFSGFKCIGDGDGENYAPVFSYFIEGENP